MTQQRQPRPIAVSQIPAQAVAVAGLLARIGETLPTDSILNRIDLQLVALESSIATRREGLVPDALQRMSFDALNDIEQSWRAFESQVTALQARLDQRGATVESVAATLDSTRVAWTLTRDSTPREELPENLRARVVDVLTRIDSVNSRLRVPRARILSMRDRAADALVTVRGAIELLRDARAQARLQVFQQNSPPLWHMFAARSDSMAVTFPEMSIRDRVADLGQYLRDHVWRLWLQLLIAVVIALSVSGLRRQASQWSTAGHPAARLSVFDRPVAAGVFIPLVLARYLHPGAPGAVYELMSLLSLLPLAVLLPIVLTREARKAGYLVIGLTMIALLIQLLVTPSAWIRVAAIGVALAGIVAFSWLLAARDLRQSAAQLGWWRVVRVGAWLGIGGLVMSIVANVFGYVALVGVLVTGTIYTAFIALAAVTAVAVFEGLVTVALAVGAIRSGMLRQHHAQLLRAATRFIRFAVATLWLVGTLRLFRILEPAYDGVMAVLTAEVTIGTWALSVGTIVVFVLSLWLAVLASKVTGAVLREEVLSRMALPRGVPDAASRVTQYAMLVLGFLFAFGAAGIDLTKLTIIVGALGVGIGFGLQNIVNNFISGLILLFERPIQIGDVVELEALMGTVKHIGIRASVIRTFSGAEVIVPNGDLISGRVINWTLSDQRRRVEIPVGVAYGSDPRRVIDVLGEVAQRHPDTIDDPPPATHFVGFGDSSLDFMIWAWTGRLDRWWQMRTEILTDAYAALAEAGIEIPFPQRDLHLKTVQEAAARALAPQRSSNDRA
jgi:small-conductance mechanosensitive channel